MRKPALAPKGERSSFMSQKNPAHLKKIAPHIRDLLGILRPGDSLLDAGCCEGDLRPKLAGVDYTGIDLWPENITQARIKHPGGRFLCGDFMDLEGSWDVVFCSRVLMHTPWIFDAAKQKLIDLSRRYCVLVLPLGEEGWEVENQKGHEIIFQTFDRARLEGWRIRDHGKYSTAIHAKNLP